MTYPRTYALIIALAALAAQAQDAPPAEDTDLFWGAVLLAFFFVAFVSLIWLLIYYIRKEIKKKARQNEQKEVAVAEPTSDAPQIGSDMAYDPYDVFLKINGLRHHATIKDVGGFIGAMVAERGNEYDPNAVAITHRNKLIGYVPRELTPIFHDEFPEGKAVCVGYIDYDRSLYGGVKAFHIDDARLQEGILRFTRWMIQKFGPRLVPPELDITIDGKRPRTAKQWLAAIDRALEEAQEQAPEHPEPQPTI